MFVKTGKVLTRASSAFFYKMRDINSSKNINQER